MTTRLLSFLGTTEYKTVVYCFQDGEHQTCYAPAALCRLLRPAPDELLVFATQEARARHWDKLQEEVQDCLPAKLVSIPAGACEAEMWDIFRIITDQVGEGDEVYFDITHGYRSLPFLSFLALAYLRTAKGADIRGVYYGAYEARQDDRVPVFDLTPFVELLDWTVAADRFMRFGDGRDLAGLAERKKSEWARRGGVENQDMFAWGRLADNLRDISLALRLIRPHEVMEKAHDLQDHLHKHFAGPEARRVYIEPLRVLLEKVGQAFESLALDKPRRAGSYQDLLRQRRLIRWYFEHQQYVQALALAREWLVSWVVVCMGHANQMYDKDRREQAERALNEAGRHLRDKKAGKAAGVEHAPEPSIPEDLAQLWASITERRNDLLHAGMREQPVSAKTVEDDVARFMKSIEELPIPGADGST